MPHQKPPRYLKFWGKAHATEGAASLFHPAAYHSLDVAAVAMCLLAQRQSGLARMAARLQIPQDDLKRLAIFVIALHDIGKFSRSFQALAPDHWPTDILGKFPDEISQASHWQLSYDLLLERDGVIADQLRCMLQPASAYGFNNIIAAIAGHHGVPPAEQNTINANQICDQCRNAASAFLIDTASLFNPPQIPWLKQKLARPLSFWLAGLTVCADWLGSNQDSFNYHKPDLSAADYWQKIARPRAAKAVEAAGLASSPLRQGADLNSLFGIETPRPMQAAVRDIVLPDGPMLAIIEDATGSGKTEAATYLAHRMMLEGKASGLYFALPTMATANAMFARMQEAYLNFYADGEKPSLALAHGKAALSEAFDEVKLSAFTEPAQLKGDDEETAAQCAAWIADDRRKAFFAEVGAGTIDQALLAVLPSKFQSLRLWGLIERLLVVDEAHAYDAYMSKELEVLLEFHSALGGSAIILSATLPSAKREDLVKAFCKGLGVKSNYQAKAKAAYPLLTIASAEGVCEPAAGEIKPAIHTVRTVSAERLGDVETVVERIKDAANQDAAVAWVRNSVDDAIEAVELLREAGINADLFHARFAMGDRQKIEAAAVRRFGKDDKTGERHGRVLVATQVIEQSLDLDFDLMVSDLAPVDLLIQRAGRLWRHMDKRPADQRPVEGPKLLLLSPDPGKVDDSKWLENLGHRGAFVYPNHALLWRTVKALLDNPDAAGGGWRAPEDLRGLIEKVYGKLEDMQTPTPLMQKENEAYGCEMGMRSSAGFTLLELKDGYCNKGSWLNEALVQTRLGEPTVTLRLARIEGGAIVPFCDLAADKGGNARGTARAWALSELSIRQTWLHGADVANQWRDAIDTHRVSWPKWQRDMLVAIVNDDGRLLLDWKDGAGQNLHYDRTRGLVKH